MKPLSERLGHLETRFPKVEKVGTTMSHVLSNEDTSCVGLLFIQGSGFVQTFAKEHCHE